MSVHEQILVSNSKTQEHLNQHIWPICSIELWNKTRKWKGGMFSKLDPDVRYRVNINVNVPYHVFISCENIFRLWNVKSWTGFHYISFSIFQTVHSIYNLNLSKVIHFCENFWKPTFWILKNSSLYPVLVTNCLFCLDNSTIILYITIIKLTTFLIR